MPLEQNELAAALHRAAFTTLTDRAFLRVSGTDAARWLNGMVTNAAQTLAPGEGNYNFLLNAQGRIQGDCLLFREPGELPADPATFLLATDAAQIGTIQAHLDRYIIMDDVELIPALEDQSTLLLLGPSAPELLAGLDLPTPDPLRLAHADTPHGPVLLLTPASTTPRFELRAAAATLAALQQELNRRNVPEISAETLEQLRILAGSPRFGTDIRDRELPQETAQTHALHFSKGCYLGQEIVERIRSRGQVNRLFTLLRLEGDRPTLPAVLEAKGKPAGELTSATQIDRGSGPELLALGYVRREVLGVHAAEAPLSYPGGTATPRSC